MTTPQYPLPTRINSRSMGLKLLVVCLLALIMIIPTLFVSGLVDDRSNRAGSVVREISSYVGGPQTFLGPTLVIPYQIPAQSAADTAHNGVYLVFPAQASASIKSVTSERRRSLFKVPVFQADIKLDADFDLAGVPAAAPQGAILDWNRAEIVIGVKDVRGAQADAQLALPAGAVTLAPARISEVIDFGDPQNQSLRLTLLGAPAAGLALPAARFHASAQLRFAGAQRLAVLAYGKTTTLSAAGDWPNPSFDGGFLPVNRSVSNAGFTASWSVPFIARGVRAEGSVTSIASLQATALGISFIEVADPYQSVNRAIKYALLFLGLLFLTYFVFEVTTGRRVHPAQYLLVGLAQSVFYLLLLSLAERFGFDLAFLLAGAATVLLLASNAGWIFQSRAQGLRALLTFTLLYALIYVMLRLEDNALLVGAVASFLAIAAVMYFTRSIDWYSSLTIEPTPAPSLSLTPQPPPPPPSQPAS